MIKLISYQKKDYLEKTSMHVLIYHIHTFCDKNSDGLQKLINDLFFFQVCYGQKLTHGYQYS